MVCTDDINRHIILFLLCHESSQSCGFLTCVVRWCVPQGLKGWFEARGCESITELSWWENTTISDSEDKSGDNDGRKSLEITCTPAQHWSLRTGCDRNQVNLLPKFLM